MIRFVTIVNILPIMMSSSALSNVSVDLIISVIDLLAIRSSQPWPEDPLGHLRDYFGNYRDPMWDVVEQLKVENV